MENQKSLINLLKNLDVNDEELFYVASKCYLISKIRTKQDNGDDILKQVYPYIFENDNINYDNQNMI